VKVLLSILRDFAPIPGGPATVEEALNRLGMAVEERTDLGGAVEGVVTARVLRTESHPDAAKVTRVWVDTGDGHQHHIWCGARNMGPGDVVPLALPGTALPDGRTIGTRAILGIPSEGMLCSGSEIGLDDGVDGLLILPADTPLGLPLAEALSQASDVLFDLDLTRNRPDCWGHLGVARDLAAHFDVPVHGPSTVDVDFAAGDGAVGVAVPVQIASDTACGMFSCTRITGLRVMQSSPRVREVLSRLGMRPINNVVDASNLVMLEYNQPNHAYDAAKVGGLSVRNAREGEMLVTLDGVERTLDSRDMLICDGEDVAIGLAGVMGGLDSEVTESTTEVMLEIAWFDPDTVRFTAARHGLRSEASLRFERGVDPGGVPAAVGRFLAIIRETCPEADAVGGVHSVVSDRLPIATPIELRSSTLERTLGVVPVAAEAAATLGAIGFACSGDAYPLAVVPPSFRPDCAEEIDLVEELARHIGYERLGRRQVQSPAHGHLSSFQKRRRLLRQVLLGLGLDEAMPSPFLAPGDLALCGLPESDVLRVANPLVAEESILRPSLRPGLLKALAYNVSHRAERIALWEIGHVYPPGDGQLPDEAEWLCVMVVGAEADEAVRQWNVVSDALGIGAQISQGTPPEGLHASRSAALTRGKSVIGHVGQVAPKVLREHGLELPVSLLEMNLSVVLAEEPKVVMARPLNLYPSSDVDLSFVLSADHRVGDIHRALRQAAGPLAVTVDLIDSYRSSEIGRSVTFRIRLQKSDGTLADSDIAKARDAMVAAAQKSGAALRA